MSKEQFSRACYTCQRLQETLFPTGQAGPEAAPTTDLRLFGTWDFKWPHNHTLVVAYQALYGDDESNTQLNAYRKQFEDAIQPWSRADAAIRVQFEEVYLPAPASATEAMSKLDASHAFINYDVLVSFAALRQELPRTERSPDPLPVDTQSSELGSYARRVDYGVPTLFLGPAKDRKAADHFEDKWFRATACHEFGHALGLAHTHQSPLLRQALAVANTGVISERLAHINDVFPAARPPKEEDIDEEIRLPWPHVLPKDAKPGTPIPYSDWIGTNDRRPFDELSVMTHFGWSIIVEAARKGAPITQVDTPQPFDFEQLRAIYPIYK